MKKRIAALALMASMLPALAQTPSSYQLKDNAGTIFQVGTFSLGGKIYPISVSSDKSGNPLSGTIGTTNPNGTALYVQGVTGGLAIPTTIGGTLPSFASPQHFICDSGCSGSGGGGISVPFAGAIGANGTPTGFKDVTGNFQPLLGDVSNGQWVAIKSSVSIAVTGTFFQSTQPISAASLPLPTGAATQTTSAAILSALGSPFQAGASIGNTAFGISGTLPAFTVTPTFNCGTGCFQATQPVSAAALPLPTGAATSALQSTINSTLGSPMQNSGGSVTANAGTNLNTSLLALETGGNLASLVAQLGAVTASPTANTVLDRLKTVNATLGSPFQAGGSIGNTAFGISGTLPAFAATPTFNFGTLNGAATAANQSTGNTSLSSIDGKTPALGQALAGASVPVVLPAAQISTLTPPAAITGFALDTSVGTTNTDLGAPGATACATDTGSCNLNAFQQRLAQRLTTINSTLGTPFQAGGSIGNSSFGISGTLPAFAAVPAFKIDQTTPGTTNLVAAGQNGTWNITNVSGAISLPTGAATAAKQPALGTAGTPSADVITVQGAASMTKLLVTPDSVALPANQSVNVSQINAVTPLMGNGVTGTGSQRVTIASDNTAFAVNPASATAPVSTMNSASAASGLNAAAAFVFDDVSPTAITENNFGFARMSANRNQYHTLRDAAGNERGQNVNANNAGMVAIDQTTPGTTNGVQSKVWDGTNTAAVKAASTAPAATDPAMVTTKSPNSPDVPFAAYSTASITRAANTTTYTVNTGWNNGTPAFFSFTAACRINGAQVLIPRIDLWSSANPTLKLTGVLWLFSAVPGTNVSDDATFTIASADFANLTGSFGGFPFTLGNNQASGAANSGVSLYGTTYQGQCASGSTTITGMVEVTNAYVPANAEVLHVGLATVGAN